MVGVDLAIDPSIRFAHIIIAGGAKKVAQFPCRAS